MMLRVLLLLASLFAAAVSIRLDRRGVTPDNPTGVQVAYKLGWLNKDTGNFGGKFTITELQPSNPPAIFSVIFYFADIDTLVQEYWGDWRVTHYQSGAHHLQPGQPNAEGARIYSFNGIYKVSKENASVDWAYPSAFQLVQGSNFDNRNVSFLVDDIKIDKGTDALSPEPTSEYVRAQSIANTKEPLASVSTPSPRSNSQSGSSKIPLYAGIGAGALVLVVATGYFLVGRKGSPSNNEEKTREMGVMRNSSIKGEVKHQPINPHVEQAKRESEMPDSSQIRGEYYDGSGYVMLDAAAEPSQRQMSVVMHYALQPGETYKTEEVEGDDYGLHQQIIHGIDYEQEEGYVNEYNSSHMDNHPPATPNVEFYLAEEVIDGTEMTQAVPIDHAYVENAIGYHQAQIEQRIRMDERVDSFPPLSPLLTLTGAGGEEMFLDHNNYSIYEPEGYQNEDALDK